MHIPSTAFRYLSFASLFTVLLTGCLNFDPVKDSTNFYILGASERASVDPVQTRVAVRDVHLVNYLDNSQVVEMADNNEIRYLSGHRWAGALDSMIAQVVASELEASLPGLYATVGDSPEAHINMDLTVLQFARTANGGAVVSIEYRMIDATTKDLVHEGRTTRSAEASGTSVEASIQQLEDSLREAVQEIAATLND